MDVNVWTPDRKLHATTQGLRLNGTSVSQRLGPFRPTPNHTGYSKELNIEQIAEQVNFESIYGGACATVTDVKRGNFTWTFTVRVIEGGMPTL